MESFRPAADRYRRHRLPARPLPGARERVPLAPAPLQSRTELVKLDVSVMDQHGQFVASLQPANLRVLDNGISQPIVIFDPVDTPADILVLVETGPAVYLLENEHLVAAYALLDGLAPDDQIALATYDQAPQAVLPLTPDKGALLAALNQLQYTIGAGDLNLYDSVSTALDWLAPATNKKALVVLTTGIDSSPPARWDALVEKARNRDVVIFPVALGGSLQAGPKKKSKKGTRARRRYLRKAIRRSIRWPPLPAAARIFRSRQRISQRSTARSPPCCGTSTWWESLPGMMDNFIRSASRCWKTPGRRMPTRPRKARIAFLHARDTRLHSLPHARPEGTCAFKVVLRFAP